MLAQRQGITGATLAVVAYNFWDIFYVLELKSIQKADYFLQNPSRGSLAFHESPTPMIYKSASWRRTSVSAARPASALVM